MRNLKLTDIRQFQIFETGTPEPGPGEVLVRADAVGICGSDIHNFQDGGIGTAKIPFPFTLGHETAGTVVALGDGVTCLKEGARVTIEPGISCGVCRLCQHGHPNLCPNIRFHGSPPVEGTLREYFAHPAKLCIPIPDSMSMGEGVFIEPLALGVHIANLMKLKPAMSVAILGCGPVGMSALMTARACGAGNIYVADLYEYRLDIARQHGADEAINASGGGAPEQIMELTGGEGVDIAVEATTDANAPNQAAQCVRIGGTVCVAGIVTEQYISLDTHIARRKGLVVKWLRRSKHSVEAAIELVESGRISLDGLISHHLPLAETQKGFELVESYTDGVFKVIIEPQK